MVRGPVHDGVFLKDQETKGSEGPRLETPGERAEWGWQGVFWAATEAGVAGTQCVCVCRGGQAPAHRVLQVMRVCTNKKESSGGFSQRNATRFAFLNVLLAAV